MENNIKIVRLKNGEDIIGNLAISNNDINIAEPMLVSLEHGHTNRLIMSHWLPVQIIKKNETTIHMEDVLTLIEPNDDLVEYYSTTVSKIAELLKAKDVVDEMEDEQIEDILEAMADSVGKVIH
jgi:hypothetical protein